MAAESSRCAVQKLNYCKGSHGHRHRENKFQIVIPQHVRELVHVEIGDFLEAGAENGKIIFTPKSLVDRHVAEGLEDARNGRTHGPYGSAEEAIAALDSA